MRTETLKRLNFHHLHYFWVVAKEGISPVQLSNCTYRSRRFRHKFANSKIGWDIFYSIETAVRCA